MPSRRYPLQPLQERRDELVEQATQGLAVAVAARASAERDRARTEEKRAAHASGAERVRASEHDALRQGVLRAEDLARANAWEARLAAEQKALAAEVEGARRAETAAHGRQTKAQADLAARRADADAVAKDRSRWEEGERKAAQAREDEDMEEAFRRS
jgi:hypothetical protein